MTATRTLVVVDGLAGAWADRVAAAPATAPYLVLPLGVTTDGLRRANPQLFTRPTVEFVDVASLASAARDQVAGEFPRLMHAAARQPLAGGSLLERLADGAINLWWLSEISEKSVFRGRLVNGCYQLALIRLAIDRYRPDRVMIAIGDEPLAESAGSLKGLPVERLTVERRSGAPFLVDVLARRLYLLCRLLTLRAVIGAVGAPRPDARIWLFASFPLNWSAAFSESPGDRMYGALGKVLAGWKRTGYLLWVDTSPRQLWRYRRQVATGWRASNALPLNTAVALCDYLRLLSPSRLVQLWSALRAAVSSLRASFAGFDVRSLFRADLHRALANGELALNELIAVAIRRATSGGRADFVVHWGEFQPVEKAIWYGLRGTGARAVAFQHTTATPMFLNYSFLPGEFEDYRRKPETPASMPLPDLFVSTGAYATGAVVRAGFPEARARICGGIRFRGLLELATSPRDKAAARRGLGVAEGARVMLVTTATKPADNENMVDAVAECMRRDPAAWTLLVKCHPMRDEGAAIAARLQAIDPRMHVTAYNTDVPLPTLIAVADVMVGNSSASGLESIALGTPMIFFHNPHVYDVSVLYSMPESILFAADAMELAAALRLVTRNPDAVDRLRAAWPARLQSLLHRIDTHAEARFLAFVRESLSTS